MKKTIAVLFHENTHPLIARRYTIAHMARYWREDGHKVVFIYGTDSFVPADVCIVHVDVSVVDEIYLEFARQYPVVLNGEVRDIRKSTFSRNIVKPGESYDGPVIVKSDLNYAGWPEQLVVKSLPGVIWTKLIARMGLRTEHFTSPRDYLIFDRIQEVPERYFSDRFFIVEKFLPEKAWDTYYTNLYVFLGESYHCFKLGSTNRIVYSGSNKSIELIEPHPEIVNMRRKMKFDYGKFDYCIHNWTPVLLDTNKLIGMSNWIYTKSINEMVRARAEGLYGFI